MNKTVTIILVLLALMLGLTLAIWLFSNSPEQPALSEQSKQLEQPTESEPVAEQQASISLETLRTEMQRANSQLAAQFALTRGPSVLIDPHLAAVQQVLVLSNWGLERARPDTVALLRQAAAILPRMDEYSELRTQLQADSQAVETWLLGRTSIQEQVQQLPGLIDKLPQHPMFAPSQDDTKRTNPLDWVVRTLRSVFVLTRYTSDQSIPPDAVQHQQLLMRAQIHALLLEQTFNGNTSESFNHNRDRLLAVLQQLAPSPERESLLQTIAGLALPPAPELRAAVAIANRRTP